MLSQISGVVLVLAFGTRIYEGEAAIGTGYIWFFSIPAGLLAAILLGSPTHERYLNSENVLGQASVLVGTIAAILIVAPIVTVASIRLMGFMGLWS